jgi:undecaprenyl-phosphate 4-deoxy-4-formamido-L-arabinose transferase
MNSFTAFSVKPLRIATTCGVLCAVVGVIMALYTIIRKLVVPSVAIGYSSLMAVQLFVGGMIMFMLGLIGEYVGRIYISLNNSPQYVIRETLNVEKEAHSR